MLDALSHLTSIMLLALGALLPIVGPLTDAPVFLQLTSELNPAERNTVARAVAINSFLLLLASTLIGAYVLDFFGLSIPAVQVAGGIVVCAIGWTLLEKPDAPNAAGRASAAEARTDMLSRRAFYPLTMPLTVGPGSISVAITLGANPHADARTLLITDLGHVLGIFIVSLCVYICYRYAQAILSKLGDTGSSVIMRLSAFLLICIGVQITWNGLHGFLVSAFPKTIH